MTNAEYKAMLKKRTMDFSVSVLRLFLSIPKGVEFANIKDQLNRAATSVGANYREANKAESFNDFSHKFSIAAKEISETEYWLGLLSSLAPDIPCVNEVWKEAHELMLMFAKTQSSLNKKRA